MYAKCRINDRMTLSAHAADVRRLVFLLLSRSAKHCSTLLAKLEVVAFCSSLAGSLNAFIARHFDATSSSTGSLARRAARLSFHFGKRVTPKLLEQ